MTAPVCPTTASQRSRTSVLSRTLRRRCGGSAASAESSAGRSFIGPVYRVAGRAQSGRFGPARTGPRGLHPGRRRATCAGSCYRKVPMPALQPAVTVERLVKIYKTSTAVNGIDFALEPGSITGLLGGNGAGKTTTIAMIMGLVAPTSGTVQVLGAAMPRQRYRVLHRMNFESPYDDMPMRLTIRQNLTVFGRIYGVADLAERINELAEQLDLVDLLDRPTGKLSAGQKTRVSLAKALINRPDILLLDEPTASLDPDTADWVRGRLERYRAERGATVLPASHNMAEVERLCERVIIMKKGRIEDDDPPATLLARYGRRTLEEVFLDVARGRAEAREAGQAREAAQ